MKSVLRLFRGAAFLACTVASIPLAAEEPTSVVEKLDDGTLVVTDCWGKSPCIKWSSDSKTVKEWIANAVLDGETVTKV